MSFKPYLGQLHELGVLFVHGIGQSKQGETLARFGEPLRAAIAELAQPASVPGAAAGQSTQVKVDAAWLSPPHPDDPCRAELQIENVQALRRRGPAISSRWLLAEAWWAAQFPPPSFSEIAIWATSALPGTLLSHVDRRLRRAGYAIAGGWKSDSPWKGWLRTPRWFLEWAYILLALAALPVVVVILLLLIAAGLLPAPFNQIASVLQRALASTIGDSYAFKQNRIKEGAIRRCVLERLEWLAARCRRVVVLAHSQGAAIAHQVLRAPLSAPCDVFVSCGSGLAKLTDIERDEKDLQQARPKLWLALGGAILSSASMFALVLDSWRGVHANSIDPLGMAIVLSIFPLFAIATLAELSSEVFAPPAGAGAAVQAAPTVHARTYAVMSVGVPCVLGGLLLWSGLALTHAVPLTALSLGMTVGLAFFHGGYRAWQRARSRFLVPMTQWQHEQDDYRDYYEFTNRLHMRWLDLFTRHDPVPNGALMDEFRPPALESFEVCNLGSTLFDHTTYFSAPDALHPTRFAHVVAHCWNCHAPG